MAGSNSHHYLHAPVHANLCCVAITGTLSKPDIRGEILGVRYGRRREEKRREGRKIRERGREGGCQDQFASVGGGGVCSFKAARLVTSDVLFPPRVSCVSCISFWFGKGGVRFPRRLEGFPPPKDHI